MTVKVKSDAETALKEFLRGGEFLEFVLQGIAKFHVSSGDLVIDGGANRGRHTRYFIDLIAPKGKVVAVEAIPQLAKKLAKELGSQSCEVIAQALVEKPGRINFFHCVDANTLSGIRVAKRTAGLAKEELIIEGIRLDDLAIDHSRLSLIKLDLEGGEYHALRGGQRLLRSVKPVLVCEHGCTGAAKLYEYSNIEYFNFLIGLGYTVYDFLGRKMSEAEFQRPNVWYFVAVDGTNPGHNKLVEFMPAILIEAAQRIIMSQKRALTWDVNTET